MSAALAVLIVFAVGVAVTLAVYVVAQWRAASKATDAQQAELRG